MVTRTNFLLLTHEEKKEMIIKFMELMGELEKNYPNDKSVTLHKLEHFEKYQKLLTKLQSLMMEKSYANTPSTSDADKLWKEYADGFKKLKDDNSITNKCLYAGWISTMDPKGKYCLHPSHSKNNDVKKLYGESNGCGGKNDRSKIKCNPAVFGFKSIEKQTLFCVDSTKWSHNSSVACMNEALKVQTDGDSKDVRIKYLVEQLEKEENKGIYQGIQEFIFKFCVCSEKIPEDFNAYYGNYMKPHRTCYGLMKMIGETSLACTTEPPIIDTKFFKELQTFKYEEDKKNPHAKYNTSDRLYAAFLKKFQETNQTLINNMCSDNPTPPTPEEPVKPKVTVEEKTPDLKVEIKETKTDYCTVEATTEPLTHEGWTFSWDQHERYKPPQKKVNGIADDDTENETPDKITHVPRKDELYQICGKLTKDNQKDISACKTIPIKASTPVAPIQNRPLPSVAPTGSGQFPTGQGPFIPSNNTNSGGVR